MEARLLRAATVPCEAWLIVGLALAFPAPAPAQTIKPVDLVGTWRGETEYEPAHSPLTGSSDLDTTRKITKGSIVLTLWSDGLFWHVGDTHGGGRWRLVGDTLWLGNHREYQYGVADLRFDVVQGDTVDSLRMPMLPRNDSTFWTRTGKEKPIKRYGGERPYFHRTAYKISLVDQRLFMTRIDDRSNDHVLHAKGVFERFHAAIPDTLP